MLQTIFATYDNVMFRIVKSGGKAAVADWALASKALQLFNVEINPQPLEENGLAASQTSAHEEFLRDSFIKHENEKSQDEEKKYVKRESSSKVALAQSLSIHRPDLVLIAEDGRKILGHRSLLSLFSPVFRQLLPLHDQHESLLALSLPFSSEPLFAFHRFGSKNVQTIIGNCYIQDLRKWWSYVCCRLGLSQGRAVLYGCLH